MLVLGVETSTPAASVCLATEQGVVASTSLGSGLPHLQRAHGRFVTEAIRWCLQSAELVPDDVKGVAVSLGPGLFTGMRVGIATAQAFAHARQLPVVGRSARSPRRTRRRRARRRRRRRRRQPPPRARDWVRRRQRVRAQRPGGSGGADGGDRRLGYLP